MPDSFFHNRLDWYPVEDSEYQPVGRGDAYWSGKPHLQRLTLDFQQWDELAQELGESKGASSQSGNKKSGQVLTFAAHEKTRLLTSRQPVTCHNTIVSISLRLSVYFLPVL
jgi:hypothetical protein